MPETIKAKVVNRIELSLILHPEHGYGIGLAIKTHDTEITYALDQALTDMMAKAFTAASRDLRKETIRNN